ncbi:MAG: prepilin-type N-terminal cleavage/methylation domain-containing protein [Chthoniobacteraceae bacterium]
MNAKAAFTLLELTIAVLIVAVLTALMLSATQVARARGDASRCVTNLRQLATANLAYAADNESRYVPAQDQTNTIRWHGVRHATWARFDPTKGPLAPYLGQNRRVKICPALERVLTGADTFEDGTGGYGYNATYIGGTPRDPFTPELTVKVIRPSGTLMFADCAFPRDKGLQEYAFAEPWQWVDYAGRLRGSLAPSVHFRHAGRAHIAWCDGHVTAEKPERFGGLNRYGGNASEHQIGWLGSPDQNGIWNPLRSNP